MKFHKYAATYLPLVETETCRLLLSSIVNKSVSGVPRVFPTKKYISIGLNLLKFFRDATIWNWRSPAPPNKAFQMWRLCKGKLTLCKKCHSLRFCLLCLYDFFELIKLILLEILNFYLQEFPSKKNVAQHIRDVHTDHYFKCNDCLKVLM